MTLKLQDLFYLLSNQQEVMVYPGGETNRIAGTRETLECYLNDNVLNSNVAYIETNESTPDIIHINVEEPERD